MFVILLGLYRTSRFHVQLFEKNFHNNCSKAVIIAKILRLFFTSMLYYLSISYDIPPAHTLACIFVLELHDFHFWLLVNNCIVIDWLMTKTIVVFRSLTDLIYLLNMLLQVR